MFDRAKLKTPVGTLTAVSGEAFDGHPAIIVWMKESSTDNDVLLAEIRYNASDKSIEMGDFRNKLCPDFTKIYVIDSE